MPDACRGPTELVGSQGHPNKWTGAARRQRCKEQDEVPKLLVVDDIAIALKLLHPLLLLLLYLFLLLLLLPFLLLGLKK